MGPSQLALGAACIALGLFPVAGAWLCYRAAVPIAAGIGPPAFASLFGSGRYAMELHDRGVLVGVWAPLGVSAIVAAALAAAFWIRRSAAATTRAGVAWACGSEVESEELRFKASHYYTPLKALVRPLLAGPPSAVWRPVLAQLPTVERAFAAVVGCFRPAVAGKTGPRVRTGATAAEQGRAVLVQGLAGPSAAESGPAITRILNPDTWAYVPLVGGLLSSMRRLAASTVGLPQVYPAWNLIGLALSFIFLFLLWR